MDWREAYQQKVHLQLDEWKDTLARLHQTQATASGQDSEEADRRKVLHALLQIAVYQLEELRQCKHDQWEFSRQAVERAMINFKQALNSCLTREKGKLATVLEPNTPVSKQHDRKG